MSQVIHVQSKVKAIGTFRDLMKKKGYSETSKRVFSDGNMTVSVDTDGSVTSQEMSRASINAIMQEYAVAVVKKEAALKGMSVVQKKDAQGRIHLTLK